MQAKAETADRNIGDTQAARSRLQAENAELAKQVEEAESQINQLTKAKKNIQKTLEETR